MQMEAPISAAICHKVRLRRDHGPDAIYAQIGVPGFSFPFVDLVSAWAVDTVSGGRRSLLFGHGAK